MMETNKVETCNVFKSADNKGTTVNQGKKRAVGIETESFRGKENAVKKTKISHETKTVVEKITAEDLTDSDTEISPESLVKTLRLYLKEQSETTRTLSNDVSQLKIECSILKDDLRDATDLLDGLHEMINEETEGEGEEELRKSCDEKRNNVKAALEKANRVLDLRTSKYGGTEVEEEWNSYNEEKNNVIDAPAEATDDVFSEVRSLSLPTKTVDKTITAEDSTSSNPSETSWETIDDLLSTYADRLNKSLPMKLRIAMLQIYNSSLEHITETTNDTIDVFTEILSEIRTKKKSRKSCDEKKNIE